MSLVTDNDQKRICPLKVQIKRVCINFCISIAENPSRINIVVFVVESLASRSTNCSHLDTNLKKKKTINIPNLEPLDYSSNPVAQIKISVLITVENIPNFNKISIYSEY